MKIKSYFTSSVESALQRARGELGPDAMLLHSRKAPAESSHLGEYEVVFALGEQSQSPAAPPADHWVERITRELADLRREVQRNAVPATLPREDVVTENSDPRLAQLRRTFSPELAELLLRDGGPQDDPAALVARRLQTAQGLSQTVVLVGPAGSGRTSTLIKLAVREGLLARKNVQLLTLDIERIGAERQLQALAAAAGLSFRAIATESALDLALDEFRSKDLILVDTPAYDVRSAPQAALLSRVLRERSSVQVHLVVEAYRRGADLRAVLERFNVFYIDRLIVTKLDETADRSSVLEAAVQAAKPISYCAAGQQIPEDLWVADSVGLANWMTGGMEDQTAAMAA